MNEEKKEQELQLEELGKVNGGAALKGNKVDTSAKYKEFELAWEKVGFPAQGATRHQLEAMCDEWEAQGFVPGAVEFLTGKKWW